MRKRKVSFAVIILLVFLVVTGISVLRAYRYPDYAISYETDQDEIRFHIEYNGFYFNDMNTNIGSDSVVIRNDTDAKDNTSILSRVGLVKSEEMIPFKIKGMGKEEISVSFMGRYQDTVCIEQYEVSVSEDKILVTKRE